MTTKRRAFATHPSLTDSDGNHRVLVANENGSYDTYGVHRQLEAAAETADKLNKAEGHTDAELLYILQSAGLKFQPTKHVPAPHKATKTNIGLKPLTAKADAA